MVLQPAAEISCIDCGGRCFLLTPPREDGIWIEGDTVAYRCEDCLDRWDLVLEDDDDVARLQTSRVLGAQGQRHGVGGDVVRQREPCRAVVAGPDDDGRAAAGSEDLHPAVDVGHRAVADADVALGGATDGVATTGGEGLVQVAEPED